MKEPVARGVVLVEPAAASGPLPALAREAASILRAMDAPAEVPLAEADYVIILLGESADVDALALPDLADRAGTAVAVTRDASDGRAVVALARKRLRRRGATLGARELVFSPDQFGHLGLESDGARERFEILLRALVNDAERLRLKREGWEEPVE